MEADGEPPPAASVDNGEDNSNLPASDDSQQATGMCRLSMCYAYVS